MRILVPVKLTIDVSQLKFESDGSPLLEAAPKKMGEADKCALEEAVRLKEKLGAVIAAATIGSTQEHVRVIRDAYAMGADEGYLVKVKEAGALSALSVSMLLAALAEKTGPYDIIFLGAGSSDTHSSTVGPVLASLLHLPVIAGADSLQVSEELVEAKCVMEDGAYTFKAKPPIVVTVTSEANEPRIPSLKAILRSKRMSVKEFTEEELGQPTEWVKIRDVERYVVPRKRVVWKVEDSPEEAAEKLLEAFRKEGVIP